MKEMEERARQLLEIARAGHDPRPVDATRVRAALKARVLAEPALLQATSKPPLEASLLRKLALAFGAGGGAGFAAGLYVAHAVSAPAAGVEAPALVAHVAVASDIQSADSKAASAAPQEAPVPAASLHESEASDRKTEGDSRRKPAESGTAARSAKVVAVNGPNPLKAELDGLRRAQELLHQGQFAWAVARLNELDRAQVGSVLLEERTATRAIAECKLAHNPKLQVQEFEQRFPRSAHLEQVRASCSGARQSGTPEAALQPAQTENAASRHE
jgi:hypothetical protein